MPPSPQAYHPSSTHLSLHFTRLFLLLFTLYYLPRSLPALLPPASYTSLDRPVPDWLEPLVRSPLWTSAWVALGSAAVGIWWGVKCRTGLEGGVKGVKEYAEIALYHLVFTALFAALALLLGAPLTSCLLETLALAAHLANLTVLPALIALGVPRQDASNASQARRFDWGRVFLELNPKSVRERDVLYPAVCAVLGAWVGIIPLALDWDRPWQAYPLPPLIGSTILSALAALPSVLVAGVEAGPGVGRSAAGGKTSTMSRGERWMRAAEMGKQAGSKRGGRRA